VGAVPSVTLKVVQRVLLASRAFVLSMVALRKRLERVDVTTRTAQGLPDHPIFFAFDMVVGHGAALGNARKLHVVHLESARLTVEDADAVWQIVIKELREPLTFA
jgi:hypothetical protein